jgi:Lon protease-like protein
MSTDAGQGLEGFGGAARLFPLPNVVMFPCVTQGLHIFEPRYRQMTTDALAGDQLLAIVLLKPGWESDYLGQPPVFAVGCLGRIVASDRLSDGRYNLQLRGLARVEIGQDTPSTRLYRTAPARILNDVDVPKAEDDRQARQHMLRLLGQWCQAQEKATEALSKLIESDVPLGMVCDVLAYVLPLELAWKQELLETTSIDRRAAKLLAYLDARGISRNIKFPPDFSTN